MKNFTHRFNVYWIFQTYFRQVGVIFNIRNTGWFWSLCKCILLNSLSTVHSFSTVISDWKMLNKVVFITAYKVKSIASCETQWHKILQHTQVRVSASFCPYTSELSAQVSWTSPNLSVRFQKWLISHHLK